MMPPLILHNVPDEERYTGEDGIQRPYAMIWPDNDRQRNVPRTRARELNETGSFGKSMRRSRSRTGSAAPKREDANMQYADRVFTNYLAKQQAANTEPSQRNAGRDEAAPASQAQVAHKEPIEIILRGYASPAQQYAAINHYEQLAGRICEDYTREPPMEARRWKSDLRDPGLTRRQPMTMAERVKVNKTAGGEHWVKVTFESQEAASAALFASPQTILGHLIYAEPYLGLPPMEDAAVLDVVGDVGMLDDIQPNPFRDRPRPSQPRHRASRSQSELTHLPNEERTGRAGSRLGAWPSDSPPSTASNDSATVSASSATISTATVTSLNTGHEEIAHRPDEAHPTTASRRIPGARRITLLPAEAALRKSPTFAESLLTLIPLLGWFSGAMIGNEVPRTEAGEFDMGRASLYWKIMYWLDLWFRLFGHELVSGDKED
ncbi:hypothetical protein F4777DRAFT_267099 [Nemania sp. FL0916]|nr:hypothetical protein F4777DRAFT_267099 [Nemania sp. FL0916]